MQLDQTDLRILGHLQEHARMPNVELAALVSLSPAACLRRLRALEEANVILRYGALLDPRAVNLALTAWIKVRLDLQVARRFELFEQNIKSRPEVLECYLMTGDTDYLVRAVAADVDAYERFLKQSLSRIEGVVSTNTSFGLRTAKFSTALPIDSGEIAGARSLRRPDAARRGGTRAGRSKKGELPGGSGERQTAPGVRLDEIDFRILDALQRDARISNVDLADRVGLSPAPCLRRVRSLEKTGVIRAYVTLINPSAVDLAVIVWTQVRLDLQVAQRFTSFEEKMQHWREVPECYLMAGDADYLARVVVPDVADYERFLIGWVSRTEGVVSTSSSFVLRVVKYSTELPLDIRRT